MMVKDYLGHCSVIRMYFFVCIGSIHFTTGESSWSGISIPRTYDYIVFDIVEQ